MKKVLVLISLCCLAAVSRAQFLGSSQVMYFTTQADMIAYTSGVAPNQLAICNDTKLVYKFDAAATSWAPSDKIQIMKSTVVIDGKTAASTKIFTTPPTGTAFKFYPTQVTFRAVNISGVTTPPSVSVGTNSTNYNNIVTSSLLSTVLNTIGATGGAPQSASFSYPINGATDIYVKVGTGAIATNYTFTVEIIGAYDTN